MDKPSDDGKANEVLWYALYGPSGVMESLKSQDEKQNKILDKLSEQDNKFLTKQEFQRLSDKGSNNLFAIAALIVTASVPFLEKLISSIIK